MMAVNEAIWQLPLQCNDGSTVSLSSYFGQVLVIVNVASRCGFTSQYTDLQLMYEQYHQRGFSVLAFPCNQFGQQEPGDDAAIAQFCHSTYQVSFPLFAKTDVNGANAHPLFRWLKSEKKGLLGTEKIKWNFTKFLVDRQGQVVARFGPRDRPIVMSETIELLL